MRLSMHYPLWPLSQLSTLHKHNPKTQKYTKHYSLHTSSTTHAHTAEPKQNQKHRHTNIFLRGVSRTESLTEGSSVQRLDVGPSRGSVRGARCVVCLHERC